MAIPPDGLKSFQLTHILVTSYLQYHGEKCLMVAIITCVSCGFAKKPSRIDHTMCCRKDYVNQSMCFMDVMWHVMIYGIINTIWYNKISYLRMCTAYIPYSGCLPLCWGGAWWPFPPPGFAALDHSRSSSGRDRKAQRAKTSVGQGTTHP